MGSGMTTHRGDRTLAQRVTGAEPEQLLTPVWVTDVGRNVPGVLLAWEQRAGTWWGLVAWDAGRGRERTWLPASRLSPITNR
jgi:hypothetical protein